MEDIWVKLYDRDGPLGHERPASMLLLVFSGDCSIHCHSVDEEDVPVLPGPLMARGQNNRRLARWKASIDLWQWDFMFRTSQATLARLPRILQFLREFWSMPLPPVNTPHLLCLRNAHALSLLPAALASVSFGFVLVRFRVQIGSV